MANPTGHTYRYGEHNPLTEPSGMRVVRKDQPTQGNPYGQAGQQDQPHNFAEQAWDTARHQAQEWGSAITHSSEQALSSVTGTIQRYPVMAFLGAVAAGFALSVCLDQCMESSSSRRA